MSEASHTRTRLLPRLLAELAIIVLGVLIALWADGWVAERSDRAREASRVEALRDNVSATRERLRYADGEARAARDALTAIALDPSRVEEDGDLVLVGLLFGPIFTPEMNVYSDLKNSGDLALLRSTELRQALARMDAELEEAALLQADINAVQQLTFDGFVIREFALARSLGPYLDLEELPTDGWTADIDPRVLRNLALFKLDLVDQLVGEHARVADILDEVEAAIDGSLRSRRR